MQEISPVRPANKTLTMIVLVMAFIYNVVFGFLRDPAGTDNTLSWLGYDYPHGFLLWGALMAAAYFLNLLYLYTKFGCRNRTGAGMAYTALLIAPVVVFINDWGWEQWVHLVATILLWRATRCPCCCSFLAAPGAKTSAFWRSACLVFW